MKLNELLRQYNSTTGEPHIEARLLLAAHAAMVLPELVDELNRLRDRVSLQDAGLITDLLVRVQNVPV